MKIRCKNCYRVLEPQELYCKSCGTFSPDIDKAMKTGDYGGGIIQHLRLSLILYLIIAFVGSGVFMIIFGAFTNDATQSLFNRSNTLLITSLITGAVIYATNLKYLKDFFWNGNLKQLIGSIIIGIIFIVMFFFLTKMSSFTRVLPNYITDYLHSGYARLFSGKNTNLFAVGSALLLVILVEEFLFRRLFIDFLDEQTMLSDLMIVLIGAIVGTVLDFAWLMAPETLITSFLLNLLLTGIYINTNRSLIINIVIRIIIVIMCFIIYLV